MASQGQVHFDLIEDLSVALALEQLDLLLVDPSGGFVLFGHSLFVESVSSLVHIQDVPVPIHLLGVFGSLGSHLVQPLLEVEHLLNLLFECDNLALENHFQSFNGFNLQHLGCNFVVDPADNFVLLVHEFALQVPHDRHFVIAVATDHFIPAGLRLGRGAV